MLRRSSKINVMFEAYWCNWKKREEIFFLWFWYIDNSIQMLYCSDVSIVSISLLLLLVYSWTRSFSFEFDGENCHKFPKSHSHSPFSLPISLFDLQIFLLHIFLFKKKLQVVKKFLFIFSRIVLYIVPSLDLKGVISYYCVYVYRIYTQ